MHVIASNVSVQSKRERRQCARAPPGAELNKLHAEPDVVEDVVVRGAPHNVARREEVEAAAVDEVRNAQRHTAINARDAMDERPHAVVPDIVNKRGELIVVEEENGIVGVVDGV